MQALILRVGYLDTIQSDMVPVQYDCNVRLAESIDDYIAFTVLPVDDVECRCPVGAQGYTAGWGVGAG